MSTNSRRNGLRRLIRPRDCAHLGGEIFGSRTSVTRSILFGRCFRDWIAALWPHRHDFIAIDGKTARRTHDYRKGLKALHTLSAYATTARLTLAQTYVPRGVR